jgi:hypothetical protein
MAKKKPTAASTPAAGKRRTREHVIADLSVNFVERFLLEGGFTGMRHFHDYGYDVTVETFDRDGQVEEGCIFLQLEAVWEAVNLPFSSVWCGSGSAPFSVPVQCVEPSDESC